MKYFKLLALLLLVACSRKKTAYETTVLLQNWHGNPISNFEIRFHNILEASVGALDTSQSATTVRTDAGGKVVLNYELQTDESMLDVVSIYARENALFKGLQYIKYSGPAQSKSEKKQFVIKMDSLIPFKTRLVKTDTTLATLLVSLGRPNTILNGELRDKEVYNGKDISLLNIRQLDTIITHSVLKNATTSITASSVRNGSIFKTNSQFVQAQPYRDSLLTLYF